MSNSDKTTVEDLQNEITRLESIIDQMERQLLALYSEKDSATGSDLVTEFQKTRFLALKEEK